MTGNRDGGEAERDLAAGDRGDVAGRRGQPAAATGGQPGQRGTPADERGDIATARRVVVKVGSSSLTTEGRIDDGRIAALAGVLAARVNDGSQVVLVSSGAIAAGLAPLRLARRPRDLATQQAAASVGQGLLVAVYTAAFARHGIQAGQILLTADDLMRRAHYRNAQRTLGRLLELGVLPVVNENDTVATDEIRFGDNDRLAALVAHVVRAGALILLSDVDGLYDFDPRHPGARRISRVEHREDLDSFVLGPPGRAGGPGHRSVPRAEPAPGAKPAPGARPGPEGAPGRGTAPGRVAGPVRVGTGGMVTKVDAALIATEAGIPTVVARADQAAKALAGDPVGTYFAPHDRRPATRQLWLAHAASAQGTLTLDAGAVRAVVVSRASLLPAGITGVVGSFDAGDPVDLSDPDGHVVARGLVNYDATEIPALMGRSTRWLAARKGPGYEREVVHRDDLVILGPARRLSRLMIMATWPFQGVVTSPKRRAWGCGQPRRAGRRPGVRVGASSAGLEGGLSCPSATSCAAVGAYRVKGEPVVKPLVARWNGTAWTVHTVPMPCGDRDGAGDDRPDALTEPRPRSDLGPT